MKTIKSKIKRTAMTPILKKSAFITLLSFATCLHADILKLDDLIQAALMNSPDIKISKADYEASQQQVKQADSDYLPRVDAAAMAGQQSVDYGDQTVGIAGISIKPGKVDTNLLAGQVTAKQLIYDFGKTTGNMEYFKNQSHANKAAMQQSISNKIFAVKKAYYSLLSNHALLDVNTEDIRLNEEQLNRSERYFEAGIRTKVDITDAKVNLIQAQLSLQNTRYDLKLALNDLTKEIGVSTVSDPDDKEIYIIKPESENIFESLPKIHSDVSVYKDEAFLNRAELEQYTQRVNAARSMYTKVDGDYYPTINANADYLMQDVDEDAFAPQEQWKATLSLEWNLYSGNRTDAQNEEAKIMLMRAEADLENARLRIQKEVDDAYIEVNKQQDSIRLSESLSIASKEKFIQVQKRYEYGLADYIELQQARQSYIDSRARLMQGYYLYFTALAQLDRAVGK